MHLTPDAPRRLALVTDRAAGAPVPPAPPPCPGAGGVYDRDGLRIPLLPPGVHWVPCLAPGGLPAAVAVLPGGHWLTYRVLTEGEDWRAMEAELAWQLTYAVRAAAVVTA